MTKSDKDVQNSEEESVPLSTRDVELEPVSLRDIEMILAPGKAPPPLGNKPPPAKSGGARLELPKPARLGEAAKAKSPVERPTRPAGVFDRKPVQRDREDSATIDLDALVGGKKASAPPPLATNLDVVIAPREPRVPKPPPRAPLKNRASVPDDGPTALTKEVASPIEPEAKPAEAKSGTADAAPAASPEAPLEPKQAELTSSGPQALEDFVVDHPVEAPSTPPPSTPPAESAPPARPVLKAAPKPPRKVRTTEDEASDTPSDKASDEQPPKSRRSNRPRTSVAAKSVQPRARESASPAAEQRSRPVALYAALGLLAAGGVLYAATRSEEAPKAPAVATASATSTATATQAASVATPLPNEPTSAPVASAEAPPTTSAPSSEPVKTATGTLPLPTNTSTTTEPKPELTGALPKPTATVAATTAPAGAPFDQGAAKAALGGAMGQATGCKAAGDPSGVARVSVTFAPSGRVTQAMVQGPPFAGTATGGCIARAFKSASVPPFSGDPVTVQKTVNMP